MMRCSDCMFFQEGEKVTFNNWFMPREETKCSLGVTLIMVPGYGVIPGPPYNLPPNQVDYTFNAPAAVQCDICPNFNPGGGFGGYGNPGTQPPTPSMSDHKVGNGSSCFLTSACVDALGKEDDCHELTTLRKFRDEWLINQDGGKGDIVHYYAFAPSVVTEIDKMPNRIQLYKKIYDELVAPCVKLIEEERMEDAWELYRAYAMKLISRYGLSAA